jgi:cAMP-binding proteins - catabolite gene activator and regulatory subunit of cAMP-dependent protein kinases
MKSQRLPSCLSRTSWLATVVSRRTGRSTVQFERETAGTDPSASGEFWQGRSAGANHRKISQETLAEMIGTTRSRVSFFMNKFRELGLIDYNGHIEVHSSLLNVVLHDQPQIKTTPR